jgi:hypothetical protein
MPKEYDYESSADLANLSDGELRELVRQRLDEIQQADMRSVLVNVSGGRVTLSGRVGTESELRIAEHTLTDVLGIEDITNTVVVDPTVRAEAPEAADRSALENEVDQGILGDPPRALSPEAKHLEEDLEDRLYGTSDVGEAIESGASYDPPDTPTPEGLGSDETRGEAH